MTPPEESTRLGPVQAVRRALLAGGVADTVAVFDRPLPTAAAAAHELGCERGAIANSLVFSVAGEALLIVASGAARVDLDLVARTLEISRIERADAGFVHEHTGQRVGGVAPVGHPVPLRTVLDVSLREFPQLWAGAGAEEAMFSIGFDELRRLTSATVMEVR